MSQQRSALSYWRDSFVSFEEITQFSVSQTELGHFTSGDINSKYIIITENLTFKKMKMFNQ